MAYRLYGDKGSGAFCVEAALAEAGVPYASQMQPHLIVEFYSR
jgi:hypothetical protein